MAAERPLLQYGPLNYSASMTYRYLNGTGLRTILGRLRSSEVHSINLDSNLAVGRHWLINYATTASFYTSEEFRDPVDHSAAISAGYKLGDWSVAASSGYSRSNDTLLEIGAQTTRDSYNSNLSLAREIGDRTSLELSVSHVANFATGFASGRIITTTNWIRYQITPRLNTGIGFSYGANFASEGADSNYTRPQVILGWRPTEKITLSADAGYEFRKFRSDGQNSLVNPVYTASLSYAPIAPTLLSLSANAAETGSYFASRATRSTGWSASVEQRILGRVFLTGRYSEHRNSYIETNRGLAVGRRDKGKSIGTTISTVLYRRTSISVFYSRIENISSFTDFDVVSDQYGLSIGLRF